MSLCGVLRIEFAIEAAKLASARNRTTRRRTGENEREGLMSGEVAMLMWRLSCLIFDWFFWIISCPKNSSAHNSRYLTISALVAWLVIIFNQKVRLKAWTSSSCWWSSSCDMSSSIFSTWILILSLSFSPNLTARYDKVDILLRGQHERLQPVESSGQSSGVGRW